MKLLKCKTCGGSDLRPFQNRKDLVKCTYCGSLYKLDSQGNIQTQEVLQSLPMILKFVLVFAGIAAVTGILNFLYKSSEKETKTARTHVTESKEQQKEAKGEILELHEYEVGTIAYYIGGFYKNTGEVPISQPKVEINFYDENDHLVNSITGFGFKHYLEPNEITAFVIIADKKEKNLRKEIKHYPEVAKFTPKKAKLEIIDSQLRKEVWRTDVLGRLKNIGNTNARLISVNAVFLNENKKIVGQSFSFVNEKILSPNQITTFKISVYGIKPAFDYWLETWGYETY